MEPATLRSPTSTAIQLKSILVPVDFSDPSNQAFRYAARFAQHFAARSPFCISCKLPSPLFPRSLHTWIIWRRISRTRRGHCKPSPRSKTLQSSAIQTVVRTGLAAHEIVEAARELDSDLIVIATHGYTGWKHLCIGSTTERVVRTAPCPVFVVREKQHELF